MKRLVLLLTLAISSGLVAYAQQERPTIEIDKESTPMATYQEFGGFILDLTSVLAAPLVLPKLEMPAVDPYPYFKKSLQLGLDTQKYGLVQPTYNQQNYWGIGSWGTSHLSPLNSATFKINDNISISTYGDYDSRGYKRPNPAALPWEKNNFRGAFEIKSSGGATFRIEVNRQGSPHGYW